MKCFTKVVYLFVAFNILDCSYAYNMPISEASYRFIQLVLSIHSSESNANLIWWQHGVVIGSDQRRPTSSNPEDYVVRDIILWDPFKVFFRILPHVINKHKITLALRDIFENFLSAYYSPDCTRKSPEPSCSKAD